MKKITSYISHTNKRAWTTEDTPEQMGTGIGSESLLLQCEATSTSASSSTIPASSTCTVATSSERNSSFDVNWPSCWTLEEKKWIFQQV
jgi:hypothetical protein